MYKYLLLLLIITTTILPQTTRYVSKTGNSTPPYTSWETACDSIRPVIDICTAGDTVFIDSGVYYDTLDINVPLTVIGKGIDETTIVKTEPRYNTVNVNADLNVESIKFLGRIGQTIPYGSIVLSSKDYVTMNINNCDFSVCNNAIECFIGNLNIKNSKFVTGYSESIYVGISLDHSYTHVNIDSCEFYSIFKNSGYAIAFYGRYMKFTNSFCHGSLGRVVYNTVCDTIIFENNICSTYSSALRIGSNDGMLRVNNNIFHNGRLDAPPPAVFVVASKSVEIQNNIFYRYSQPVELRRTVSQYTIDYNCIYENSRDFDDTVNVGEHNIYMNPMWAKMPEEDNYLEELDLRLQKYSACIDAGDPEILDADGTRSDIGVYGGIMGLTYDYEDLAPIKPVKPELVSVSNDTYHFTWEANTENDLAGYKIYLGTVDDYPPIPAHYVSSTDSNGCVITPDMSVSNYLKITAYDNQGNESEASKEYKVNVTGVDEQEITNYNYKLYNNYPNPFNPATNIRFSLKEAATVIIKLYDIKGELVKKVCNKNYSSGNHEIRIDGTDLPSGIYIVNMRAENSNKQVYNESIKITLVK